MDLCKRWATVVTWTVHSKTITSLQSHGNMTILRSKIVQNDPLLIHRSVSTIVPEPLEMLTFSFKTC